MSTEKPPNPSAHYVRLLAVRGHADPRTVIRWLRGHPVASTTTARLEAALAALNAEGVYPGGKT